MKWLKEFVKFLFTTQKDMIISAKQDAMVIMNNNSLSKNDKIKGIQKLNEQCRSLKGKYSGMTEISSMKMAEFDNQIFHKLGVKKTNLDKYLSESFL